jgi:hypothetical protein
VWVFVFGCNSAQGIRQSPRHHKADRRGTPMDDVLLAVDLDHRPVGVHADDLAPADAPEKPGALQTIERAPWMTCEQARGVPAQQSDALGPVRRGGDECLAIGHKLLPPVQRYIERCSGEVETGNAAGLFQEDRVALPTAVLDIARKLVTIVGS